MQALIVHCHPEPTSFNATLKDVAEATLSKLGYGVTVSDLYAEGFDPVEGAKHYRDRLDPECFSTLAEQRHASMRDSLPEEIRREIARLEQAELVVFQFPIWWHAQPAMLKGWFDRVFVNGSLYSSTMRYDRGRFRGKRAICCVTTGAPERAFGPRSRGGDIAQILWPAQFSLYYMGFAVLPPFIAYGIQGHGFAYQADDVFQRQLDDYKTRWARRLEQLDQDEPLPFPGWNDWDEHGHVLPRAEAG